MMEISMKTYQERVGNWMRECFGDDILNDGFERNARFLEEALELVQSLGMTRAEANALVEYTYGRPVGHAPQEVGGVMVCLAALCTKNELHLGACAENELTRIEAPDVMAKIRVKQQSKPLDVRSSLPGKG